ncbi:MAG: cupredoxin domain-containing protein [bacterium]|nr:cupredoxin domain-containing protein [bacterium]
MKKINKESGIASIIILLIVLGIIGVGGGAVYVVTKNRAKVMVSPSPTPTESPSTMKMVKRVTVKLNAQNSSKQSGEAVLTEIDGKVKVELQLAAGASEVAQPAHIHVGSCPKPGEVKYPLTSVVNGSSETMLDVSLNDLTLGLPLAINVHKSSTEPSVYVACGDLTGDGILDMMLDISGGADVDVDVKTGVDADVKAGVDVKVDVDTKVDVNLKVKEFSMTSWYEMKDGKAATNFSLKEIKVKKGDTVRIKVTNTKGNHDFSLDEYGIKKPTPLDQEVVIEFKADKVGSFKYYCSMAGHRMMGQEGTLTVEE